MKKSNIVLIGMPGAGKSTVGVVLAKTAALEFVDTDLLIQKQTGRKLQEIIDNDGIDEFLKIEGEIISRVDCKNSVIATGGSAVFSESAMNNLRRDGVIVFLDVPLAEIKRRVDNITTRGIAMKSGETLETVYNERLPLYKKYADITVDLADTEHTVKKILEALQ
ncbi:MAG: shikimate kinase [Acutalibacteraceae bacterium]|nr:shikimate kinase [Acutalibacteraceae bacterium]